MATTLLHWIREHTSIMRDRHFPSNTIELKRMAQESTRSGERCVWLLLLKLLLLLLLSLLLLVLFFVAVIVVGIAIIILVVVNIIIIICIVCRD